MIRTTAILAVLAMLGGCATQQSHVATTPQSDNLRYRSATASALAIDPPILAGQRQLDLSRDGRSNSAYLGFEDTSTTYYSVQMDDQQEIDAYPGRYMRRTISERDGVISN